MDKVYIASPLFNPTQIERIQQVEEMCEHNEIEYFSPRSAQFGSVEEGLTDGNARLIFNNNVEEVENCDVLIAILDDKDTGTAWEIGMAFALNKRIILVQFDKTKVSKTNIMLSNCGNGLTHIDDLYSEYIGINNRYLKYGELE